ncbi:MAG: tetratricopeptide repeat protein [Deltaproteobacteria bacterium]|nr:tetratricopeptide repeat protein [Deltaproteobacteria bacterium]
MTRRAATARLSLVAVLCAPLLSGAGEVGPALPTPPPAPETLPPAPQTLPPAPQTVPPAPLPATATGTGPGKTASPSGIETAVRRTLPPEALGRLTLDVWLVNDPDFPPVTPSMATAILAQARATLSDKLGFGTLELNVKGGESVQSFIGRHAGADKACLEELEPLRVRPSGRRAVDVDPKLVRRFLSRWSVESLAAFFPEAERRDLTSYDAIASTLLAEFDRKVATIADFKLANGQSLLAADKLDLRSYVNWICALRNQDDADLVLTNELILYDLASEPYPHSIFAKCKVGGASLLSPRRRAIYRRAVFASTFSMVTDLPFFQEDGVLTLAADDKLKVIGTFIVAHELGHAVFKLPDFYDHPPQCLMTTKYETGYVSGYRDLLQHPGPCPACQPWVDAKRFVFQAEEARRDGKWDAAIDYLRLAIKRTPKQIDGNYVRYIADLSVQVAQGYAALGKIKDALAWLKAALRIVPDHEEAVEVQRSIEGGATKYIENKEPAGGAN